MDPVPLIVFLICTAGIALCVIKDIRVSTRVGGFRVDYWMPPTVGVLVLLASRSISVLDVWNGGVVGNDLVTPGYIMIIFNSTAYIYTALDHTGVLSYVAFKVVAAAGKDRRRLFVAFYLLSCALTLLTSNDITILTLTPLICYCSRAANMDPKPFLFAEFYPANIMSAIFLIDNPTNIIVGQAFDISFLEYLYWNALPSIVAAIVAFAVLYLFFRSTLTDNPPAASLADSESPGNVVSPTSEQLSAPLLATPAKLDPGSALTDRMGAIFLTALVLVNRILLTAARLFGGEVWSICLATAGIAFLHNAVRYPWKCSSPAEADDAVDSDIGIPDSETETVSASATASLLDSKSQTDNSSIASSLNSPQSVSLQATQRPSSLNGHATPTIQRIDVQPADNSDSSGADTTPMRATRKPLPTLGQGFASLPLGTIPFVFSMFVMVQALTVGGWIEAFAKGLATVPGHNNPVVAVFWMTCLSTVLCNCLNNQPATILLTSVLAHPAFLSSVGMTGLQPSDLSTHGTRAAIGSVYGVILGSNFAASFTLLGALAGIMFSKILAVKRVELHYATFAGYGFRVMPLVVAAGCATLWVATLLSDRA